MKAKLDIFKRTLRAHFFFQFAVAVQATVNSAASSHIYRQTAASPPKLQSVPCFTESPHFTSIQTRPLHSSEQPSQCNGHNSWCTD